MTFTIKLVIAVCFYIARSNQMTSNVLIEHEKNEESEFRMEYGKHKQRLDACAADRENEFEYIADYRIDVQP